MDVCGLVNACPCGKRKGCVTVRLCNWQIVHVTENTHPENYLPTLADSRRSAEKRGQEMAEEQAKYGRRKHTARARRRRSQKQEARSKKQEVNERGKQLARASGAGYGRRNQAS